MGSYKLNNIDLEDYGIYAGQAPGSNIAVAGCFDLPKREGDTYHSWDDEDGIEPYTDADDIKFAGRDISFYGVMDYSRVDAYKILSSFYATIKAFTDLVSFETPYGTFQVYVTSVDPTHYKGATTVKISLREPIVDLTGGVLPDIASDNLRIDKIPLTSFGLYVSAQKERTSLTKGKEQSFTAYGFEGYQLTKREPSTLLLEGYILASSQADFIAKIKALYAILSASDLRTFDLAGEVEAKAFSENGFSVSNVIIRSEVVARFSIRLIIASERFYTSTDFYYSFPLVFPFTFGSDEAGGGLPIPLT